MGRGKGLRLGGGLFGGRIIRVPTGIRPTEGRVRGALLSIWHERLAEARLLELFAGSGAVGLEALGRGAARVTFVEADGRAVRVLRENVAELGVESQSSVVRGRLPEAIDRLAERDLDLVFVDPPYELGGVEDVLAAVRDRLAGDGEVVLEHSSRVEAPIVVGLDLVETRRYGGSCLSRFRLAAETQSL